MPAVLPRRRNHVVHGAAGRHHPGMLLLVPGDPLHPRRPDQHFAAEAEAALEAGVPVALVDRDALRHDRPGRARRRVPPSDDAYRGWTVRSGRDAAAAGALAHRDVLLRT